MSFREKHLWISIVSTVLVWGFYFWKLIGTVVHGGLHDPRLGWVLGGFFIGCLFVVVLIEIVLTILATLTTRKSEREARDERETLAALKASHVSLMALISMVFCLSMGAYFLGLGEGQTRQLQLSMANGVGLILVSNILLAAMIVSELIRYVFTLGLIRRGR